MAQLLTPMLLQRSWTVTSIIRDPEQVAGLQKLGEKENKSGGGKLNVRVWSLEDCKSDEQARGLIEEVGPDYVVFSAGAGGKGDPERVGLFFLLAYHFRRMDWLDALWWFIPVGVGKAD